VFKYNVIKHIIKFSYKENNMKKDFIKLIISIIFTTVAFFIKEHWIRVALFLIGYLSIGYEVIFEALKNVRKKTFGEEFLMSIASIGAFTIGEYPEAIAVMLFFQVGEMFEEYAEDRSKKSIESLMNLKPDTANVKEKEKIVTKAPEKVKIGDIILVTPGERVPLDGIVVSGEALIDTSALTGESVPRAVKVNSEILSGVIDTNGVLEIKVTKEFQESTLSKILNLVENAGEKKAHTEKFITKFARIYTPIVILLAVLILAFPTIILKQDLNTWLYRALSFLVVSCPCALVVSVPLSFFGGIGGASRRGILVKGSNYLELLSKLETIVFDKTGTLTKGNFKVQNVEAIEEKDELLKIAAYVESFSNHPIAKSILESYGKEINKQEVTEYEEISGNGVTANIKGQKVHLGNSKLMSKIGIEIEESKTASTIVYIAIDRQYAGKIEISDEIKEDSTKAIEKLKNQGIKKTVMLTGDRKQVGEEVAKKLKIDKVYTELLPTDKVEKLQKILDKKKGKVAFVGDGLNDAPALAMADIGIAMGGYGTDAAIEAADIVIMTDEPLKICEAINIARKTMKISKENIVFAISLKLIALLLVFFGVATMWEAVFADVGVTVLATLNSLRTLKK
jgi:Cd2+/Zn2+-exporting ATPase